LESQPKNNKNTDSQSESAQAFKVTDKRNDIMVLLLSLLVWTGLLWCYY